MATKMAGGGVAKQEEEEEEEEAVVRLAASSDALSEPWPAGSTGIGIGRPSALLEPPSETVSHASASTGFRS